MRVNGDAMIGAGISNGDVVIVDRSAKAANGKVVIASLNGEMLIRRLERHLTRSGSSPRRPGCLRSMSIFPARNFRFGG